MDNQDEKTPVEKDRRAETSKQNAAKAREARAAMKVEKDRLMAEHKAKLAALKEAQASRKSVGKVTVAPKVPEPLSDQVVEEPVEEVQPKQPPAKIEVFEPESESESDETSEEEDSEDEIVFRKVKRTPVPKTKSKKKKAVPTESDIESMIKRLMESQIGSGKVDQPKVEVKEAPRFNPVKKTLQLRQGFTPAQAYRSKIQSLLRQ